MTHRIATATVLVAAALVTCSIGGACSVLALGDDDAWARAVADGIADDLARVERYDATVVERGIVPGDPDAEVASRVRFRAPGDVVVRVESPAIYRGDTFAHLGTTVLAWSERLRTGVRIRNVPASTDASRRAVLRATARHNLATYAFQQGADTEVAGRLAIPWTVTPFESGDLRLHQKTAVDATFALPLRTVLTRPGAKAILYQTEMTSIRINDDASAEAPTFDAPTEDATWIEWDLAAEPIAIEKARERADFMILEPPASSSLRRTAVIAAKTRHPSMLCVVYGEAPFWATVTQTKDRGLADPKARGIVVDLDGDAAKVNLGAVSTSISFVRHGVDVNVATNLPLDRAVAFARSLVRAER